MIFVGIGGSSCSGKSTISNYISKLLDCSIVHQDAFYHPDSKIPKVNGIMNWDCPQAIDFEQFHSTLQQIKNGSTVQVLGSNRPEVDLSSLGPINDLQELANSIKKEIILIDGFLLYQNIITRSFIDVSIFLYAPYETLRNRRLSRQIYKTREGEWADPPDYFDNVVWPMYVQNSQDIGNVTKIDTHSNSIKEVLKLVLEEIARI